MFTANNIVVADGAAHEHGAVDCKAVARVPGSSSHRPVDRPTRGAADLPRVIPRPIRPCESLLRWCISVCAATLGGFSSDAILCTLHARCHVDRERPLTNETTELAHAQTSTPSCARHEHRRRTNVAYVHGDDRQL